MSTQHKNKTLTCLLGLLFGSIGAHRFYLKGKGDQYGWLHFVSVPISILVATLLFNLPLLITISPLMLSFLISLIETLVLGLKSDEKWDQQFNPTSGKVSDSSWPLALILVLTVGIGAIALIFTLARTFDLLYTGGSYG